MSIFKTIRNVIDNIEDAVNRVEINIKPEHFQQRADAPQPTSGLSLVKGQRITLEKNGQNLTNVCVGVNWGMINGRESVDLDVSCITYMGKQKDQVVYYGNLRGTGISHSGDDLTGSNNKSGGNQDNERIQLNLVEVNPQVDRIFIVLNSYRGHKFDSIPYATIRIYEGDQNIIANYDVANDNTFKGSLSMVLGELYRHGANWKFNAIGEATRDAKLPEIVATISNRYI